MRQSGKYKFDSVIREMKLLNFNYSVRTVYSFST